MGIFVNPHEPGTISRDDVIASGLFASVVNYCDFKETVGCVSSLVEAGLPADRVVVVDNASPDGSGEELAEALEGCHFLQAGENGGYGPGNNLAISYLLTEHTPEAEYFFILNPDVRVQTGTVETVVRLFENSGTIGGLSCVQWRSAYRDELDANFENWLRAQGIPPARLEGRSFVATESLLGAAMILSREAFLRVGGFDPLYFLYFEEEDLARRLRYHGFDIGVAADAHVVHHRPYRDRGEDRHFHRRTSKYLFQIKDPFSHPALNVLRAGKAAGGGFLSDLRESDRSVRSWLEEMAWVVPRVPAALRHRSREMEGAAHL